MCGRPEMAGLPRSNLGKWWASASCWLLIAADGDLCVGYDGREALRDSFISVGMGCSPPCSPASRGTREKSKGKALKRNQAAVARQLPTRLWTTHATCSRHTLMSGAYVMPLPQACCTTGGHTCRRSAADLRVRRHSTLMTDDSRHSNTRPQGCRGPRSKCHIKYDTV